LTKDKKITSIRKIEGSERNKNSNSIVAKLSGIDKSFKLKSREDLNEEGKMYFVVDSKRSYWE